jgi:hypothetical protein
MRLADAARRACRSFLIAAGLVLAGWAFLAGCQRNAPPVASGGSSEADVEAVLIRFSEALAAADTATLRGLTTPDFTLLDEGRAYDLGSLGAAILPVLERGSLDRVPLDFHTRVRGDAAWSHYRVGGMFASATDTTRLDLLESAVLVRDSTWRVALAATLPAAP